MIRRLKSLTVDNFRTYRGSKIVPLDADVILLFGLNGSGKTNLLYALEYAITGVVSDLKQYVDDYPRSLVNVYSSGASVSIEFEDESGARTLKREVDGRPPTVDSRLSLEDRRFFTERCYLSQLKLGRLLEVYQRIDKDEPEQPLVNFARELLGLGMLEHLVEGLYEVGDVRRLETGVPGYASLSKQRREVASTYDHFEGLTSGLENSLDAAIAQVNVISPADQKVTRSTVRSLQSEFLRPTLIESTSTALRSLEYASGRLSAALTFLNKAKELSGQSRIAAIAQQRERALAELAPQEKELLRIAEFCEQQLTQAGGIGLTRTGRIDERLGNIERAIPVLLSRVQAQIDLHRLGQRETAQLEKRISELDAVLADLSSTKSVPGNQRELVAALGNIIHQVDSNVCPVCDRDFTEVGAGSLREHLVSKLQRLGADVAKLEMLQRQAENARSERSTASARLERVRGSLQGGEERVQAAEAQILTLRRIQDELSNSKEMVSRWRSLRAQTENLQNSIEEARRQTGQAVEAEEEIRKIAQDFGISEPKDVDALAASITVLVEDRKRILSAQLSTYNSRRQAFVDCMEALSAVEDNEKQLEILRKQKFKIESAWNRVQARIAEAREICRAAVRAKESLISALFQGALNNLWADLFSRLAHKELFRPQISDTDISRGKVKTQIQGTVEGIEPFGLASVLSAGNLNTAALSLFLSLHLLEQPRHKLLLLDDPVQNVDDVHVMHFANVLRSVAYQTNRQVLVSVHDRALFDYLCLELGPTVEGRKLLAIQLQMQSPSQGTHVSSREIIWADDDVRFGPQPKRHVR